MINFPNFFNHKFIGIAIFFWVGWGYPCFYQLGFPFLILWIHLWESSKLFLLRMKFGRTFSLAWSVGSPNLLFALLVIISWRLNDFVGDCKTIVWRYILTNNTWFHKAHVSGLTSNHRQIRWQDHFVLHMNYNSELANSNRLVGIIWYENSPLAVFLYVFERDTVIFINEISFSLSF